jgi:hypothetical protein
MSLASLSLSLHHSHYKPITLLSPESELHGFSQSSKLDKQPIRSQRNKKKAGLFKIQSWRTLLRIHKRERRGAKNLWNEGEAEAGCDAPRSGSGRRGWGGEKCESREAAAAIAGGRAIAQGRDLGDGLRRCLPLSIPSLPSHPIAARSAFRDSARTASRIHRNFVDFLSLFPRKSFLPTSLFS